MRDHGPGITSDRRTRGNNRIVNGRSGSASTKHDVRSGSLAETMLQLQRTIGNAACVKVVGQLLVQRTPWDVNWGGEIDSLSAKKNVLSPSNANFASANSKCQTVDPKVDLTAWATRFRVSLRAPTETASAALIILNELTVLKDPTNPRRPLGLPSGWLNELYEFVNVKRLYESGDTTLTPGHDVWSENNKGDVTALKPDYLVAGDTGPVGDLAGGSPTEGGTATVGRVGDHVREQGARTAEEVKTRAVASAKSKLTTYPQMRVSVVVDASTSPAAVSDLCGDLDTPAFVPVLKRDIPGPILGRLDRLTVIIKDRLIVINATDLT